MKSEALNSKSEKRAVGGDFRGVSSFSEGTGEKRGKCRLQGYARASLRDGKGGAL